MGPSLTVTTSTPLLKTAAPRWPSKLEKATLRRLEKFKGDSRDPKLQAD